MKFSAHLGYLWPEAPLIDRISLAAEAGFDGVDIPSPYDMPVKDLQRALLASGLTLVSIAAPPPNYTGGAPGYLGHPGAESRFQNDLRRALRYADALGAQFIHLLAGPAQQESQETVRHTITRNLDAAVAATKQQTLLISAARQTTISDSFDAAALVAETESPALRLRVDLHEALQMGAPEPQKLAPLIDAAAFVAVADGPNRVPPGRGTLPLEGVFDAMRAARYDGWVSAAYSIDAKDRAAHDWRAILPGSG